MAKESINNNLVLELHVPHFAPLQEFYKLFGFDVLSYDPASDETGELGYIVLVRRDTIGNTLLNFYGDRAEVTEHTHFKEFPAQIRQEGMRSRLPFRLVISWGCGKMSRRS